MIDLDAPPAELYAQIIALEDEVLEELMGDLEARERIIDVLIGHLAGRLRADRAAGLDAVIHVKLWDRPGGGYDHRELIIRDGRCTASERPSEEPRLTLKVRPDDLRKIVTGETGPKRLAFRGRLRAVGDVRLGWGLSDMFDLSTA